MKTERRGSLGVVKEGYLLKKGMGYLFRPWRNRRILIDKKNNLQYYDGNILKGDFCLEGKNIRHLTPAEADGRKYAFEISNISNKQNPLVLAASSEQEADDWVDCMIKATTSTISFYKNAEYSSLLDLQESNILTKPIDIKKIKESKKKEYESKINEEDDIDIENCNVGDIKKEERKY